MAFIDFLHTVHNSTPRNYMMRVTEHDRVACAEVAGKFGEDYWDGDRKYGYGGYRYDGRWKAVAQRMVDHYGLKPGHRVLDVGCGKGFLLHDFTQVVPGIEIAGIDVSDYAISHAKEEVRPFVQVAHASSLPFEDDSFDFVVSLNVLHCLTAKELHAALQEMERVGKGNAKYFVVESFRNEREKANMLYWQLTCRSFHDTENWQWVADQAEYTGDIGFIFFE